VRRIHAEPDLAISDISTTDYGILVWMVRCLETFFHSNKEFSFSFYFNSNLFEDISVVRKFIKIHTYAGYINEFIRAGT
jgi:hypothetical protein